MADLVLRTQNLLATLGSLPSWMAGGLFFAPTILALFTRSWRTIFSTALLNAAGLVALATGQSPNAAVPIVIVTFSASLVFALHGLHERRLSQTLSALEAKVNHIDEEMITFLRALERRSDMIDEAADEARKAYQEARKQLPKALPTHPQASLASGPTDSPVSSAEPATNAGLDKTTSPTRT